CRWKPRRPTEARRMASAPAPSWRENGFPELTAFSLPSQLERFLSWRPPTFQDSYMPPALMLAVFLHSMAPDHGPFSAEARIREAIATVQPVAYRSAQVDWEDVEAEMGRLSEGAVDTADLLPAYQTLLSRLGYGHSFLQAPAEVLAAWRERHGDQPFVPDQPPRRQPSSAFVGRGPEEPADLPLPGGAVVRRVTLPAFAGGGAAADAYADRLFRQVAAGA